MRAALRVVLGLLVVVLGWLLAADHGLVPGRVAVDWLRERIAGRGPPALPPTADYDGEPLRFELREPPAEFYGDARDPAPEDEALAAITEAAGATYDPALAHAAREYATLYGALNAMLPGDALAFLLDAAGVVGWGVRQSVMVSNARSPAATERYLRDLVEDGARRIGVGVADLEGRRVIAALSTGETPSLSPVPRTVAQGARLPLVGRLPKGYRGAQILAMRPDLSLLEVPVVGEADAFAGSLVADAEGIWTLEILGQGPFGPAPVTQLTVAVGDPAPEAFNGAWPRDESAVHSVADAEARAAELLAADRARFERPTLLRDPALDAIARAHAEDMRAHDFVGHQSPRTGGPGDRLAAAGYQVIGLAENVAFNRNLGDAQSGLMRSLGHRRNLLSKELTHVGLGAASDGESWYLTQLFATPMPELEDPVGAAGQILGALNGARRAADAPDLEPNGALTEAAERTAKGPEPSPRAALDEANDLLRGKASAWVGKMASLAQFEPPPALFGAHFRRAGVAVRQDRARPPPNIFVVLVLSQ